MSKYPLGPWARTDNFMIRYFYVGIKKFPYGVPGPLTEQGPLGFYSSRSGSNNIDKTKPSDSGLLEKVSEFEPALVTVVNDGSVWLGAGTWEVLDGGGFSPSLPEPPRRVEDTLKNLALKRFFNKLDPELDLLIVVGEMKETLGMFKHRSNALFNRHDKEVERFRKKFGRRLRGGTFKKRDLRQGVLDLSGYWLEYNFGIAPLVSDVQGAAQAVSQSINQFPRHSIAGTCKAQRMYFVDLGIIPIGYIDHGSLSHRVWMRDTVTYSYKYGATFRPDLFGRDFASVSETFGLTENRILPAIDELMPYSWLAAYFSNYNDLLEAHSAPLYVLKDKYSVTHIKTEREASSTVVKTESEGYKVKSYTPLKGKYLVTDHSRLVEDLDGFMPVLQAQVPDLKQAANVTAVLAQKVLAKKFHATLPEGAANYLNELIARG